MNEWWLIQTMNGLQYGFLLFLVASGLTLIFGTMGIINLAHGSFYMIGAYLSYWLTEYTGNFFVAILLAVLISIVAGIVLERLCIARLYHRDHLYQILLTYALILIFNETRSMLWGNEVHGVAVPVPFDISIPLTDTQDYPVYRLFISVVCLGIAVGLYLLIQWTRLGMLIRAGANNRDMVRAMGFDIKRLFSIVFGMGVALAAFAGMIAAPISSVYPGMGEQVLILSFVVVIVGGAGSVRGAFVAAMLFGLTHTFSTVLIPAAAGMVVYATMVLVLLWRPRGIFARI